VFIGLFLRSFDQPAWNIDYNGLAIIITFARFMFAGHARIDLHKWAAAPAESILSRVVLSSCMLRPIMQMSGWTRLM